MTVGASILRIAPRTATLTVTDDHTSIVLPGRTTIIQSPAGMPGPTGPQGPEGPPGGSTNLFEYDYNAGVGPPPGAGTFRADATLASAVNTVWIHRLDKEGVDRKLFLMTAREDTLFFVQDLDNSAVYARYVLTADPVDNGNYVTYPLFFQDGAGSLTGNNKCLIGILIPGPPGSGGGGGGGTHEHIQMVASTTWSITHNLGFFPQVSAFDTGGDEIEGEVTHINNDNLTISFNVNVSGVAYLS